MRSPRTTFLLLILTLTSISLCSTKLFSAERLIIQSANQLAKPILLKPYLAVYEDQSGLTNPDSLLQHPEWFKPLIGFPEKKATNPYYLKCALTNNSNKKVELALLFKNLTYVELFIVKDGKIVERRQSGFFCKAKNLAITDTRTHFEVDINAGDSVQFLIRVKHTKHQVPIFNFAIQDNALFDRATLVKQTFDFFFFGAFAIFFLASLLSFLTSRNRLYLWIAIYSFGISFYDLSINGYLITIIAPNHGPEMWWLNMVFVNLAGLGGLLLIQDFFQLKNQKPSLHKLLSIAIYTTVFQLIVGFTISIVSSNYLMITWLNVSGNCLANTLIIFVIVAAWNKLKQVQRLFALGAIGHVSMFILGSILVGVMKENSLPIISILTDVGGIIVISFFNIALGKSVWINEQEKYEVLQALDELRLAQNKLLEETVTIRTSELQVANQSLLNQRQELEHKNEKIEILLKENHHRVKNNLQLISSLLELHQEKEENERLAAIIADGKNRVKAMALIHQLLFQNDFGEVINMEEFIQQLLQQVKASSLTSDEIQFELRCSGIELDIDTAIPIGLIVNELLTNSFKHALCCVNHPLLRISLIEETAGNYRLDVWDNGPGLPANFNLKNDSNIGLYLIPRLCRQLQGSFAYEFSEGARFIVTFKETKTRKELQ
ncbi:MAG TPA: histidine kinase dimerization/phosphoacceptor domain -containing protein [Williamwhitmania sp.]|nr:histidine kinase dimerization/phosphoacceptor domain -containing protein [Williamwhitmania sp.]